MSLYSLTLHFRLGTVAGTTTYLARGRSLAEAKRFARAKFRTLNPEAILSRIVHDAEATDQPTKSTPHANPSASATPAEN